MLYLSAINILFNLYKLRRYTYLLFLVGVLATNDVSISGDSIACIILAFVSLAHVLVGLFGLSTIVTFRLGVSVPYE